MKYSINNQSSGSIRISATAHHGGYVTVCTNVDSFLFWINPVSRLIHLILFIFLLLRILFIAVCISCALLLLPLWIISIFFVISVRGTRTSKCRIATDGAFAGRMWPWSGFIIAIRRFARWTAWVGTFLLTRISISDYLILIEIDLIIDFLVSIQIVEIIWTYSDSSNYSKHYHHVECSKNLSLSDLFGLGYINVWKWRFLVDGLSFKLRFWNGLWLNCQHDTKIIIS